MEQIWQQLITSATDHGCTNFSVDNDVFYFTSLSGQNKCVLINTFTGIYDATVYQINSNSGFGDSFVFPTSRTITWINY